MRKSQIRELLHRFARVFMREFLLQECGRVPSVDPFVRKVNVDSSLLDFFSYGEIMREFRKWVSDEGREKVNELEKEDILRQIAEGSGEGVLDWIVENIRKVLREKDVGRMLLIRARHGGKERFVVVYMDRIVQRQKVLERLEDLEYRVSDVWELDIGMDTDNVGSEDLEALVWFLEAIKQWRNVESWMVSELMKEEVVESKEGGLIVLEEAIPLGVLYREAERYRREQPGVQDREEAGDRIRYGAGVSGLRFLAFFGTKSLDVYANVKSESRPVRYPVVLRFLDVDLSEEFTEMTPFKLIDSKSKEEFYCGALTPENEVMVRCGCPDFYFRFSYLLRGRGALIGRWKPYVPKTKRKSQNVPKAVAGCKHIFAVVGVLIDLGLVRMAPYRSKVEIDLVRKLGRFT